MIKETGFVYVLSNPWMPGLVKIGHTKCVDDRLYDLDCGSLPEPFVLEYSRECQDPIGCEFAIHKVLHLFRVNEGREFFQAPVKVAISVADQVIDGNGAYDLPVSVLEIGNRTSAEMLGKHIRAKRLAKKMSQDALAGVMGVSRALIGQIEAGKPRAQVQNVLGAMEALGICGSPPVVKTGKQLYPQQFDGHERQFVLCY